MNSIPALGSNLTPKHHNIDEEGNLFFKEDGKQSVKVLDISGAKEEEQEVASGLQGIN